jgi:hypothetical protein
MAPSFAQDFVAGLAALALFAGLGWPSYLGARSLLRGARPSTRLAGTVGVGLWLAAAVFWLLGLAGLVVGFGLFRLPIALALFAGLTGFAHLRLDGAAGLAELGADLRALAVEFARAGRTVQALAAATAGLAFLGLLRGTLAPPLGWDALTYHLLKAGRFVQAGGLVAERAPDAWSYYEYFPFTGDIFWAWALLPGRSDLWLSAAGVAIWLAALLGIYALARELGAPPRHGALAALALGAMPATLVYLSSSYVDNTTLLFFVLGAIFVVRLASGVAGIYEAILVSGLLGLMVGTKFTSAPLFALGAAVAGWCSLRASTSARARGRVSFGCLVALLPGMVSYVRAWTEKGSPFYPLKVEVAGFTLSPGNEALDQLTATVLGAKDWLLASSTQFWARFLWQPTDAGAFANPGPGAALLVLAALASLSALARSRSQRSGAGFLVACGLLTVAGFLSASMVLFRWTIFAETAGRLVTIAFACAAATAAARGGRTAWVLLSIAVPLGLVWSVPRGWRAIETQGTAGLAGVVLGVTVSCWALSYWRRSGRRPLALAGCALTVALGAAGVETLRAPWRYPLWRAASDPQAPLFHMHALSATYASAWPIWQALDDGTPHRLAVTAGWDSMGHNWYRLPLLGSRLQNLVLYVPITADGSVINYIDREKVRAAADFKAWVGRLAAARVDYVVSLAPRWTIEDYWMTSSPQLFEKVLETPEALHAVFRLRREALGHNP